MVHKTMIQKPWYINNIQQYAMIQKEKWFSKVMILFPWALDRIGEEQFQLLPIHW